MKKCGVLMVLWLVTLAAQAQGLHPLTVATWPALAQTYQGKRHALIFWSLTCVPCHEELRALARLDPTQRLPVVLINTDDATQAPAVTTFLAQLHLQAFANWQFADAMPERLRYAIDPHWYGELPRSYAVDAQGQRLAHSGKADMAQLVNWLTVPGSAVRTPPTGP